MAKAVEVVASEPAGDSVLVILIIGVDVKSSTAGREEDVSGDVTVNEVELGRNVIVTIFVELISSCCVLVGASDVVVVTVFDNGPVVTDSSVVDVLTVTVTLDSSVKVADIVVDGDGGVVAAISSANFVFSVTLTVVLGSLESGTSEVVETMVNGVTVVGASSLIVSPTSAPGARISAGGTTVASSTAGTTVVTDLGSSLELTDTVSGVTFEIDSLTIDASSGFSVVGSFNSVGVDDSVGIVSGCPAIVDDVVGVEVKSVGEINSAGAPVVASSNTTAAEVFGSVEVEVGEGVVEVVELTVVEIVLVTAGSGWTESTVVVDIETTPDVAGTSFFFTISSNWTVVSSTAEDAVDEVTRIGAVVVTISSVGSTLPAFESWISFASASLVSGGADVSTLGSSVDPTSIRTSLLGVTIVVVISS